VAEGVFDMTRLRVPVKRLRNNAGLPVLPKEINGPGVYGGNGTADCS